MSRVIREENQNNGIYGDTPFYMPPGFFKLYILLTCEEMFQSNTVLDNKIDVYSFGMILWEMTTEVKI